MPFHLKWIMFTQLKIGTDVDEVFIGTCTNGRIEDLEIVARMFKGKKLNPLLKTIIVPASNEIYFEAMNRGYIKIFMDAGAMVCNPGCGPCIGRHQGVLAPGDRALTTMNRNLGWALIKRDNYSFTGNSCSNCT